MMEAADLNSRDGHALVPRFDDDELSNPSTGGGGGDGGGGYSHEAAADLPNTAESGQWALAANEDHTHIHTHSHTPRRDRGRGLHNTEKGDSQAKLSDASSCTHRSAGQVGAGNGDEEASGRGRRLVLRAQNAHASGTLQNTSATRDTDSGYPSESCQMSPAPLASERSNSAIWREAASVSMSNMATLSQSGVEGAALYDDASRSVFSMHGLSLSNQGLPFEGSNLQPLSAGDGLSQSMGFPNFDDHHDAVSVGACTPGSMPISISMPMSSPGPSSSARSSSSSSSTRPTGAAGPSFLDTVMQAIAGDENVSSPPTPRRSKERARGALRKGTAAEVHKHADKDTVSTRKPENGASTKRDAGIAAAASALGNNCGKNTTGNQWIDGGTGLSTTDRGLQDLGLEAVSNSASSSDRHQLLRHFQQRQLEHLSGSMDFGSDDIGHNNDCSHTATFTPSGVGLASPICLSEALDQMVFSLNDERSACFGPKDQVALRLAAATGASPGHGRSNASRMAATAMWSDEDIRVFFRVLEEQLHGPQARAAFVERVSRLVHKTHAEVQLFFDRKLLYVQRLLHNFDVDCNAWNEAEQRRALLCFWNILQQRCGARKGTAHGGKVNKTEKRLLATKLFKAMHSRPEWSRGQQTRKKVVAVDRTGSSRSGTHSLGQLARESQHRVELSGLESFSRKRACQAPEHPRAKRMPGSASDARPLQERQFDASRPLRIAPVLCPKRRGLSRLRGARSDASVDGTSRISLAVPVAHGATPNAIMDEIPRLPLSRDAGRKKCLVRLVPHTKKAGQFVALHQRQKLQFRVRMGMTISDIIDKHLPKKWGTVLTSAQADGRQLRLVLVCGGITHASWGSSYDQAANSKAALQDRSSNPRSTSQQKLADSNKRTSKMQHQLHLRDHCSGIRDNTVWDLAQFCAKNDHERTHEGAPSVGTGTPRPISLEYYWRRKVQTV